MNGIPLAALTALLVLAGAAGDPASPAGVQEAERQVERMRDIYRAGFEVSRFGDCWLIFTPAALREWREQAARLEHLEYPPHTPRHWGRFDLELSGTRVTGGRYGHMSSHRCLIRATRIHSVRRLPRR